jgi:hypothetical protein
MRSLIFSLLPFVFSLHTLFAQNTITGVKSDRNAAGEQRTSGFLSATADSTLKLFYQGADVSGTSVIIQGNANDNQLKASLVIRNPSGTAVSVKVKKTVIRSIAGTDNSFCIGECYSPSVTESITPYEVGPWQNTGNEIFYTEYIPNTIPGTTEIKYEVYDVSNRNNTVSVTISFTALLTSVTCLQTETEPPVSVFPDPATGNQIFFRYRVSQKLLPAEIELRNIRGVLMYKTLLYDPVGNLAVELSGFSDGLYVFHLRFKNQQLGTGKFIIRRQQP